MRQIWNYRLVGFAHLSGGHKSRYLFRSLALGTARLALRDNPANKTLDIGRQLFRESVAWVEHWDSQNFLPPLPDDLAASYLHETLNHEANYQVPNGPHLRVFLWIAHAVEVFRNSKLPKLGKQLHVNLHESVLAEDVVNSTYKHDHAALHGLDKETKSSMASMKILAAWWNKTTTPRERQEWAVLDVHHYHAWSSACSDHGWTARGELFVRRCASSQCRLETVHQMGDGHLSPGSRRGVW